MHFSMIPAVLLAISAVAFGAPGRSAATPEQKAVAALVQAVNQIEAGTTDINEICNWYGSGPFCASTCPKNWRLVKTDKFGDGYGCSTGNKKYCCDGIDHPRDPWNDIGEHSVQGNKKAHVEVAGFEIEITVTKKDSVQEV